MRPLCLLFLALFLTTLAPAGSLAAPSGDFSSEGELRLARPRLGGQTIALILPEPKTSLSSALFLLIPDFLTRISPDAMRTEPIPGRGGGAAWHRLQSRLDNGSYIGAINLPDFTLQTMLTEKRFRPDALTPFAILARAPLGLWISATHKARNIPDFFDILRDSRALFMAGTGSITAHHMATLMLNRAAGVTFEYLPYLGSKESSAAVLANQAVACWAPAGPAAAMPGMRLLAVASAQRSPLHPEVPTLSEVGVLVEMEQYFGLAIPASATKEVISTASELYTRLAQTPEFVSSAAALGFVVETVDLAGMGKFEEAVAKKTTSFVENYPINMTR